MFHFLRGSVLGEMQHGVAEHLALDDYSFCFGRGRPDSQKAHPRIGYA